MTRSTTLTSRISRHVASAPSASTVPIPVRSTWPVLLLLAGLFVNLCPLPLTHFASPVSAATLGNVATPPPAARSNLGWLGARPAAGVSTARTRGVPRAPAQPGPGTDRLPDGLYPVLIATEEHTSSSAYRPRASASGLLADNPATHLAIQFDRAGVTIGADRRAGARAHLTFLGLGYGANVRAVRAARPTAAGRTVTYRRGRVREWYLNGPAGLEQGFTLSAPPSGRRAGERLRLTVGVRGTAAAQLAGGAILLRLSAPSGQMLRYGDLYVHDARGRMLPAHLALTTDRRGTRIRIVINDHAAAYPVTVDPTVTLGAQTTLTGPNISGFGYATALNVDGSIALIGARDTNGQAGAAYVFVEPSGGWANSTAPAATLSVPGAGAFGGAVALSRDGTTALIGASTTNGGAGAAYVFQQPSGGWASSTTPAATLAATGATRFGDSVALSADGATALVGAFYSNNDAGSAYIFNGPWSGSPSPAVSLSDPGSGTDLFGASVALNANATVALVAAPFANGDNGAAYVFALNTTTGAWPSTPTATLSVPGVNFFASSIAINTGGDTALIGSPAANNQTGAVYVFTEPNGGWVASTAPTATLAVSGLPANSQFGASVSLNGGGNLALVGAPGTSSSPGTAYLFSENTTNTWVSTSTPVATLSVSGLPNGSDLGVSATLSPSGSTVLTGADFTNGNAGSAYVFNRPSNLIWASSSAPAAALAAGVVAPASVSAFGYAVAVSGDGNVALVGAYATNNQDGAAYIFLKSGGAWTSDGAPTAALTVGALAGTGGQFGGAVALNQDGSIAFIGAPDAAGNAGTVYVFAEPAGGWTTTGTPTATIGDPINTGADFFGMAVALNASGSAAVIGAAGADANRGVSYIFTAPGGAWHDTSVPSATLPDPTGTSGDYFGNAVALSASGNVVLIGTFPSSTVPGDAYLYIEPSASWTSHPTPAAIIPDPAATAGDHFGTAVALSGSGDEALVGAYGTNNGSGAAYLYTQPSAGWGPDLAAPATLSDPAPTHGDSFGEAVALSGDGSVALIGAGGANGTGAGYVFTGLPTDAAITTAPDATLSAANPLDLGIAVALSGDGTTTLVGDDRANRAYLQTVISAPTLYVNGKAGNDGNTCLTGGSPCATIAGAIGRAAAGSKIVVAGANGGFSGVYCEHLSLSVSLKLVGADPADPPTIDGGGPGTACPGGASTPTNPVVTTANDLSVSLAGFTIQHGTGLQSLAAEGGGILNGDGSLVLTDDTITGNTVHAPNQSGSAFNAAGGGIGNFGSLTLVGTTVSQNVAAGAPANGSQAGSAYGAGIENAGTLTLIDSTVAGNTAAGGQSSGAPGGSAQGGGIDNSGSLTLIGSTIVDNAATAGAGAPSGTAVAGGLDNAYGTSPVSLTNTILAANSASTSDPDCSGAIADGAIPHAGGTTTAGSNILGDESANCSGLSNAADGDLVGTDGRPVNPELDAKGLQNHGGPTPTISPLWNSPAVAAGNVAACDELALGVDQRGKDRNTRSRHTCDIGAYDTGGAIPLAKGWNLIDLQLQDPSTGTASGLVGSIDTQLGSGAVSAVATYGTGRFSLYVPGYTTDEALTMGQGIFLLSTKTGTWLPPGSAPSSAPATNLQPGWNLVGAPIPYAELDGTTLDTELDGTCGLQEAVVYQNGGYIPYVAGSNASFHVPTTAGMWVECATGYSWTPQ